MARLTYVFDEGADPSNKDTEMWEIAHEEGLEVETVPDLYPGLAGEIEISGEPGKLRDALERRGPDSPGRPTRIQYEPQEAAEVGRSFDDADIELDLLG